MLAKNDIDLIILDISLPDQKGYFLYQDIIRDYPGLDGRFIFMSGFAPGEILGKILATTENFFVQKPFPLKDFRELIDKFIGS